MVLNISATFWRRSRPDRRGTFTQVEDQFGRDLAAMPERGLVPTPQSEFQEKFIPPADMPDRAGHADTALVNPLENQREGLTAELMFRHSGGDNSKGKKNVGVLKIGCLPESREQMRLRDKALAKAAFDLKHPCTEAVAITKNVPRPNFHVKAEDAEPLPIFARRKLMC